MRWIWFDRFLEFESGRRARSIKNVTLAEEQIADHFPGIPMMPASLITEGLAQTGGLLVGQANDFRERVVLAKVGRMTFHFAARPGDTLVYATEIDDLHQDGARVSANVHVGDRLLADGEIYFAHLSGRHIDRELFDPVKFMNTLRITGLFAVGKYADGTPLRVPEHLAEAERRAYGT